jgi:hypothetical protein
MAAKQQPKPAGLSVEGVEDDCGVCDSLGSFKKQLGSSMKAFGTRPPVNPPKQQQQQTPTSSTDTSPKDQDSYWQMKPAPDITEIGNSGWFASVLAIFQWMSGSIFCNAK